MKKVLLLLFFCIILSGCVSKKNIGIILNQDLSNCILVNQSDSHSGFLGDGETYALFDCKDSRIDVSNWRSLPLSLNINEAFNLVTCTSSTCGTVMERYNIPNIENGFYYFIDNNNEANNKYDDTYLNNRSSYNYSLAIYDVDNSKLYFYELDT